MVQQALEAITRTSKGLSLALCTRSRPDVGALLQRPLQLALQCPVVSAFHCNLNLWTGMFQGSRLAGGCSVRHISNALGC